MKSYFILTDECKYKKDYFMYIENHKHVKKVVEKFFREYGITTTKYIPFNDKLCIDPTFSDLNRFNKSLTRPMSNSLREFKSKSDIHKEYIKCLKDNNIIISEKPCLWNYVDFNHKIKVEGFLIKNNFYISIEHKNESLSNIDGFIEISEQDYLNFIKKYK